MKTEFSKVQYAFLTSLGLTFDSKPVYTTQPERGLIELLNKDEFIGNYMYGMLKLFFQQNHELIRVDVLIKDGQLLKEIGRATLSALCAYCAKELKDKRFGKISKYSLKIPLYLNSKEYVESVGSEQYLFARGIIVRDIKAQDIKKIRSIEWLYQNNIWFKNRLIFGLGVRADAFSALEIKKIKTYYELSKILNSSLSSARKNYQDFYKIKKIAPNLFSLI
ncbi:MAG: hypothetical protein Q7U04_11395 [Bacteriovorax sp.]|nr:hypothetical protein [Bacteriovorax sp.]